MARTYIPHLIFVLRLAHRYGTRYLPQLGLSLTAPQLTCLNSTLAALADCLVLLGDEPVTP